MAVTVPAADCFNLQVERKCWETLQRMQCPGHFPLETLNYISSIYFQGLTICHTIITRILFCYQTYFPPKARNATHKITPALHTNILLELFFSARNFVGQQGSWDFIILGLHTLGSYCPQCLGKLFWPKITPITAKNYTNVFWENDEQYYGNIKKFSCNYTSWYAWKMKPNYFSQFIWFESLASPSLANELCNHYIRKKLQELFFVKTSCALHQTILEN